MLFTAQASIASGNRRSTSPTVSCVRRLPLSALPVVRVPRFGRLHRLVVRWRTTGLRVRNHSRPARSALGELYPSGQSPHRSQCANQRAADSSSGYFSPFYGSIAGVFAQGTRCPSGPEPLPQPGPVVGRFPHEPLQGLVLRNERRENLPQLVPPPCPVHPVLLLIASDPHAGVCVQSNSCVEFPLASRLAGRELRARGVTLPSLYCPVEEPSR